MHEIIGYMDQIHSKTYDNAKINFESLNKEVMSRFDVISVSMREIQAQEKEIA